MSTSSWTIAHWGRASQDGYDVELQASVPLNGGTGPQPVTFTLILGQDVIEISAEDAKILALAYKGTGAS